MGKYMRKSKLAADVSVTEMSNSTLGVRTRSRTLALQRLQSSTAAEVSEGNKQSLRVKQSIHGIQKFCSRIEAGSRGWSSGSVGSGQVDRFSKVVEDGTDVQNRVPGGAVSGFEGLEDEQFGENNLDFEPIERAIRESTHCNHTRDADNISTPGSSTRYPSLTAKNERSRSSIPRNIPSTGEVDELFAHFEQQQQRFFMEKYNFDIVNDTPLPGRYEWEEVSP